MFTGQRQDHAEGSTLAGLALDLNATSVSFDYHSGLEQANAEPLLFRGVKRTVERVLQESRTHAAAIVRHSKNGVTISLARLNPDLASLSNCFSGIEEQIGDYILKAFRIRENVRQWLKRLYQFDVRSQRRFSRVSTTN